MTEQTGIKLIRLNTGEDIIANCIDDEANNTIMIGSPMRVVVRRLSESSQSMLVMMPWLPLEIIEEDLATINYQDIITVVEPKKSFIEYYNNMVDQYKVSLETMKDQDFFGEEQEDDEIDEDMMQEMLDLLKERKTKSIH